MKHFSEYIQHEKKIRKIGKRIVDDIIYTFDIEVSNLEIGGSKYGIMYIWGFSIDGVCYYGRTWEEFSIFIKELFNDDADHIIWVHNLSYEFQFIAKRFEWNRILSRKSRDVIEAVAGNIIFRCSYQLSGKSLKDLAIEYGLDVTKKTGDLDYKKVRGSKTPLSSKELKYLENDNLVIYEYIKSLGDMWKLPTTKTGFIRKKIVEETQKNYSYYKALMSLLILRPDEYKLVNNAFAGGFTHANIYKVGEIIPNVCCCDINSSYPYALISEKYPMSKGICCKIEECLNKKNILWVGIIEIYGIESSIDYENYISKSRCLDVRGCKTNNGRIMSADYLMIALTNVDFDIIRKTYTWEHIVYGKCYCYKSNYLPIEYIKMIFQMYNEKNELKKRMKQDESLKFEYQLLKGMYNSIYGMMVTNPIHTMYTYNDGWHAIEKDFEEELNIYNNNFKRRNFYLWGVFCCAYARRNLWNMILNMKDDYCYSDTDSIYFEYSDEHVKQVEKYNKKVSQHVKDIAKYFHIENGDIDIGQFSFDLNERGDIDRFFSKP